MLDASADMVHRGFGPLTGAFLVIVLVLFPWTIARGHRSGRALRATRPALYVSASLTLWGLVALLAVVLWVEKEGLGSIGLGPSPGPLRLVAWTDALLAIGLVVAYALRQLRQAFGIPLTETFLHSLPRTPAEYALFCLLLAPTAGITEEMLFRGYAITRLTPLVGNVWVAAAIALASFSLGHVYQGWMGPVRTALAGLAFTVPFIVTGSLLPSILAHTAFDMLSAPLITSQLAESTSSGP